MFSLIFGYIFRRGGKVFFFYKNCLVKLRLYIQFQCFTMPGTGLEDCVHCAGMVVCKPTIVFSLAQAEQ